MKNSKKFTFSEENQAFVLKKEFVQDIRKEFKAEWCKKKFERNLCLAFEKQIIIDFKY